MLVQALLGVLLITIIVLAVNVIIGRVIFGP